MKKRTKAESDAYMDGWGAAHRGESVCQVILSESDAWHKGYSDCLAGKIDAVWALGPELLVPEEG